MVSLDVRRVRRLALARAGLLHPERTGLPRRAGRRSRWAALETIRRFGYLQLDTVSVAGARSHGLVLMSRLDGFDPSVGETLLRPGSPVFEYWGHEASWLPIELYPTFEFRRRQFAHHPWWGDVLGEHPRVVDRILGRLRDEGPLRSTDLEGDREPGMWRIKTTKKVVSALWSSGRVAIRERRSFQRVFDLAERVIPPEQLERVEPVSEALDRLLLLALDGHGWASTGTLTATWRLRGLATDVRDALRRLVDSRRVIACDVVGGGRRTRGWIRPRDLELAERLATARPRSDRGVLLSPFDPVLWDRARVARLFDFDQKIEIYKPRADRVYGYFSLPVLAGERLVGRVDLKADRRGARLEVLSRHFESPSPSSAEVEAVRCAVSRHADLLQLEWDPSTIPAEEASDAK